MAHAHTAIYTYTRYRRARRRARCGAYAYRIYFNIQPPPRSHLALTHLSNPHWCYLILRKYSDTVCHRNSHCGSGWAGPVPRILVHTYYRLFERTLRTNFSRAWRLAGRVDRAGHKSQHAAAIFESIKFSPMEHAARNPPSPIYSCSHTYMHHTV